MWFTSHHIQNGNFQLGRCFINHNKWQSQHKQSSLKRKRKDKETQNTSHFHCAFHLDWTTGVCWNPSSTIKNNKNQPSNDTKNSPKMRIHIAQKWEPPKTQHCLCAHEFQQWFACNSTQGGTQDHRDKAQTKMSGFSSKFKENQGILMKHPLLMEWFTAVQLSTTETLMEAAGKPQLQKGTTECQEMDPLNWRAKTGNFRGVPASFC